jgi:asparagine N-glycosylation enzyme membrane subunit Stt3
MPAELKYAVLSLVLTLLSFWLPGGRVLTLPFFFIFVLVLIFWSARRSADREAAAEEEA